MIEDGKNIWCKSENHVPIVAVSQAPCDSSVPIQTRRDRSSVVPKCRQLFEEGLSGDASVSDNDVVEQLVVEPTPVVMRVSSEEESIDLLVFAERSKRPNTSKPTGRHNVFTQVCKFTKTTRAPFRNRPETRGDRNYHPQKFGDATMADRKVLDEENESRWQHRYAVVGAGYLFSLYAMPPHEERNCAGNEEQFAKHFAARSETAYDSYSNVPRNYSIL